MRTTVSLLAATVLLALAAVSTAEAAFYQRWIGTRCVNAKVLVHRYIDGHQVLSSYNCPSHTVFQNGKYYTWTRPALDITVADDYAHRWWGHCHPEWSGVDASNFNPNNNASWYATRFNLNCP